MDGETAPDFYAPQIGCGKKTVRSDKSWKAFKDSVVEGCQACNFNEYIVLIGASPALSEV
ncbi:hypothetical protein SPKIRA_00220 [Sphingomonas paucimobilis]|jgi:hypothetical protein|nr:hypothetical protein SPKIRA_00220 [Sphingomonas paucimobilis]